MNVVCAVVLLSLSMAAATSARGLGNENREGKEQSSTERSPATERSTDVSGAVVDATGGAVSGANVTLTVIRGSGVPSTVTGANGTFAFYDLPPGWYSIGVKAQFFEPYTSATFSLAGQEGFQLSTIVLSVAGVSTVVDVRPTSVIAAEQLRAEEKQRLFGAVPDFYTSYVWNAAPLNTKQKFSLAARAGFDPMAFVGTSVGASIEQARNSHSEYGQDVDGYAKRWAALFATGRASDFLGRAVFPSLFHQDPRYFYQGSGSAWSRIGHSVGYAVAARSDSGHVVPNYSSVLSSISSGALSNLYYPASSRGVGLIFTNAAIGIAERAGRNLVREFLLKRLTRDVPGNGKSTTSDHDPR
jgi:hypothetical protein